MSSQQLTRQVGTSATSQALSAYGTPLKEMSLGGQEFDPTIHIGYVHGSFSPYYRRGVPPHEAKMFMAADGIKCQSQWYPAYNTIDPALDIKAHALVQAWSQASDIDFSIENSTDEQIIQASVSGMTVALGNSGYKASMSITVYDTDHDFEQALRSAKERYGDLGVRERLADTWDTLSYWPHQREGYLKAVELSTTDGKNFTIDDSQKSMSVDASGRLIPPTTQADFSGSGAQATENSRGLMGSITSAAQSLIGRSRPDETA